MENRKDYEKRLGERLEAAYMQEDIGPVMSREEFHRLIQTAEKKKKHRRTMLSLAAACVALCLVCGGFVAGMTMRESASAGKDDETKTVQQGGSVVIGSGVSENDQNVGMSTITYTNIEDIPEDIRKEIHFLDSDEFELEKVKVDHGKKTRLITTIYKCRGSEEIIIRKYYNKSDGIQNIVLDEGENIIVYKGIEIVEKQCDENYLYFWEKDNVWVSLTSECNLNRNNIEAILDGLYD